MQVRPPMIRRTIRGTMALLCALAVVPALAQAAPTPPGVSTGGASTVSPQSATLSGSVNPKGKVTVYYFQYGPTVGYGAQTPEIGAGAGNGNAAARSDVIGLTAATTYHYRDKAAAEGR